MTDGWGVKTTHDKVNVFSFKTPWFYIVFNDGSCSFYLYSSQKQVAHEVLE
jgi:hypothetical protein